MTAEWKARVREELTKKRGLHANLARHLGITTSTLATVLSDEQSTSDHVPGIHEFLGWDPPAAPSAPIPSKDAPEIKYILKRLTRREQQRLAATLESKTDEETRALIEAFLTIAGAPSSSKK